jgi:hypothetical protein
MKSNGVLDWNSRGVVAKLWPLANNQKILYGRVSVPGPFWHPRKTCSEK